MEPAARTFEDVLRERGIGEYGTAKLPEGLSPFPELPYAVSFVLPLPRAVVKSVQDGPTKLYFHTYRTANAYIDATAMQMTLCIRACGEDALYVPASQSQSEDGLAGLVSHKAVAHLAGLGSIGRNALFLSRKYGAGVRLGTVLTSMELPGGTMTDGLCNGCNECVRVCPSGALAGVDYREGIPRDDMVDAQKCSIYMKNHFQDNGRGAVCGMCMAVCPLNQL